MSTVVPDAGGVVVISQMRPQHNQGNGLEEGENCDAPASMPKPIVRFYSGEPEVLGTTQIFTGIVLISFDIMMMIVGSVFGALFYTGVPIWAGILFIISGSLSVAASVKPTVGKVTSSLVMHIITSLAAAGGIVISSIEFILVSQRNSSVLYWTYCAYYKSDTECLGAFYGLDVYYGFLSLNMTLFMLMFCISISTSVFACKTVCRSSFQEISVVIYQTTSSAVSDTSRDVPPDSTAAISSASMTQTRSSWPM
ncbi:membrane-spanning 4-domains subfamily A member 4A-like isoform X1 [Ranitomeya imitator]|uniref:membrane-spanning 4-domains subfamily A member 4A-like isoform X1 n=1 Tax=Ranitomeya imitator TaxID=111125 RepID=UPI001AAAC109